MRHVPTRSILSALAALSVLAGCTIPGGSGGSGATTGGPQLPGVPGSPAAPKVEVQPGRAPQSSDGKTFVRADQVIRTGSTLTVTLTVASVIKQNMGQYWAKASTNSGVSLAVNSFAERQIEGDNATVQTWSVALPEGTTRSLTIQPTNESAHSPLTIPVPPGDGAFVWKPASLRQIGLAPQIQRTTRTELVLDAVRSEGLITEVDFHGAGHSYRGSDVCGHSYQEDGCVITEADGTKHPLIGNGTRDTAQLARSTGTLRFLGELDPEATSLTIATSFDVDVPKPEGVAVTLPKHADSPAQAAAGTLVRPAAPLTPVTLTSPETGAKVTIDKLDVLADHVQVHVSGVGGSKDFELSQVIGGDPSTLTEPTGFVHPLTKPVATDLKLKAGGKLDATLVFAGSVPSEVGSLNLALGGWNDAKPLMTTLTLPPAAAGVPSGATLGQIEGNATPVAPSLRPVPAGVATASASASTGATAVAGLSLLDSDVTPLPASTSSVLGSLHTAVLGVSPAAQVASAAQVDPAADAQAQRSLQDLGAKKTPDGWVLTLPETVLFDYNKADVKTDAGAKLDQVAKLLTYYDKAQIGVQGHTDSDGEAAYNLDLSKRRAQAVADALSSKGIAASRMKIEGFGLNRPVAPNTTDDGKAKNRRVEIVLRQNA